VRDYLESRPILELTKSKPIFWLCSVAATSIPIGGKKRFSSCYTQQFLNSDSTVEKEDDDDIQNRVNRATSYLTGLFGIGTF
jgi:hypothetical protein